MIMIFVILLFSSCGSRLRKDWYQQAVKTHQNQQHPHQYRPGEFILIDNNFLSQQPCSVNVLKQLHSLFHHQQQEIKTLLSEKSIDIMIPALPELAPDTLIHYIHYLSDCNKAVLNLKEGKEKYQLIVNKIDEQLNIYDSFLSAFNLSVYNLDIDHMDSVFVLHQYVIEKDDENALPLISTFEVDKTTHLILSEKLIKPEELLISDPDC